MTGTLRVFRAELYRLLRSRTAWSGAIALGAVAFLRVLAAYVAERAARAGAIQQALLEGRGVLWVATGGGKTEIAAATSPTGSTKEGN